MSNELQEREAGGRWISCGSCVNGVVSVYSADDFEGPGECRHCNGGSIWRYDSGVLALYPGGPLAGREGKPTPRAVEPPSPESHA